MTRTQANGLLVVAAFLWGAGNVAQKTVLDDIGPLTAVGLRCLVAALVLAPFFLDFERMPHVRQLQSHQQGMLKLAMPVILTFAMAMTLYQIAAGLTTVTNTGFLVNISIVITPIIGWVLLHQKPSFMVWPAAFITLIGAYLMSGGLLMRLNVGDGLAIASAFFYSLWMVFLGRFMVACGKAGLITFAQFAFTATVCLIFGLLLEPINLAGFQSALPELLWLGVASTGLGYLLQAIAQTHTSASEAAVLVSGEAIFGAVFAFVLLGETLNGPALLGALLIISGICLVQINLASYAIKLPANGGRL
jgi:drug/metabolite transporter (DMT)-like permease